MRAFLFFCVVDIVTAIGLHGTEAAFPGMGRYSACVSIYHIYNIDTQLFKIQTYNPLYKSVRFNIFFTMAP